MGALLDLQNHFGAASHHLGLAGVLVEQRQRFFDRSRSMVSLPAHNPPLEP